ncbi:MAG TPA: transglutaminase domain-containing protein [Chitinophagaceae bacterium]|nr:transglutaminase domain-containing protein [Chitinophagaceae bacterium]
MYKRNILLLIFCCNIIIVNSQTTNKYDVVDRYVKNYSLKIINKEGLDRLIDTINKKFFHDIDKVRAAFYWITENIGYNDNAATNKDYQYNNLDALLQTGKALCGGYANLIEYFCRGFEVECVTINGTGRSLYSDIILNPESLSINHSWNAVKLDGVWRLLDATWGSGYTNYKTGEYHKSRNENYFLADPQTFIYNHLPQKPEWQLLNGLVSATRFCDWPYIDEGYFTNQIFKVYPFQLYIDRKVGDTVQFKFFTNKQLSHIALESPDSKLIERGRLSVNSNFYSYTYRTTRNGEFDLRVSLFYLDEGRHTGYVTYTPTLIYRLRVNPK